MDPATEIASARARAGLTQKQLAEESGTSQATISAYESGRKQPSVATLERLLAACGAQLAVRVDGGDRPRLERAGRHLAEVIALAEALPFRPAPDLRYPRLAS